ncbi:MAG: M6 family metalloprotease domain-containing protein [Muribaculaceae bacterium]|nr:M6 family metalloprotease domain-containing protein [Muribaculaceae bacterium]
MLTAFALALGAWAVPAKKGAICTVSQQDGSVMRLTVVGDEHNHYYLTTDKKVVIAANGEYCYASINEKGKVLNSKIKAHAPEKRTAEESAFIEKLSTEVIVKAIMKAPAEEGVGNSHDGTGQFPNNTFPCTGNVKALVFLVGYSDVPFSEKSVEYFEKMITQEGFSENGATGSCRDFYVDASNGQFIPEFDVYGPVNLPNPRSYYGGNDENGQDSRPEEMMLHAAQLLDNEVDFSQYDTDGDGFVDNVFIFYAGEGEAAGGGADTVWPHQWERAFNQKFDGVRLMRYACGPELISPKSKDGIGTFCHEFGHVLGLPDLYNTYEASADYTPLSWSIMDSGCYNNNSRTPPTLSAFERNALGWMGDNLIEIKGPATCTLEHIIDSNKAYIISTPIENEFFILENRQQNGWDKYLAYHGMMIWHIDYNATIWINNVPNNNESHQCIDLIEACDRNYPDRLNQRGYPFPGSNMVTEYKFGGSPDFKTWAGENLGLDITDIKEVNGKITFDVAGGGEDPDAGISTIKYIDASINVSNRTISVSTEGGISIYDLTGSNIAVGYNSLSTAILTPGIYIVRTPISMTKVLVE